MNEEDRDLLECSPIDGDLWFFVKPVGNGRNGISTLHQGRYMFAIWIANQSEIKSNDKKYFNIVHQSQFQIKEKLYYDIIKSLSENIEKSKNRPDDRDWYIEEWSKTEFLHNQDNLLVYMFPGHNKGSVTLIFRVYTDVLHNTCTETSITLEEPAAEAFVKKMLDEHEKYLQQNKEELK